MKEFAQWYAEPFTGDYDVMSTVQKMELAYNAGANAARVGMVPEDECVRLPKVEDWPEWAVGVRLVFEQGLAWTTPSKDGVNAVSTTDQKIRAVSGMGYVKRPTPAWTPKVGDAVFWDDTSTVYTVSLVGDDGYADLSDGMDRAPIARLKPARSLDQLGKPWEEIPNA